MSDHPRMDSGRVPIPRPASASAAGAKSSFNRTIDNLQINSRINQTEKKIKVVLKEMQPVLSNAQLNNLDKHKYSCQGSTLLDPLFQPYWCWLVTQMPIWLAPNLITIIGLVLNVVTSSMLMIYSPNATDDLPSWVLYLCAIGLFVYQSLDAIDGKQARRTNSSSPLGELFDHGCDAISTVFVMIAFTVTIKLGTTPWIMFLCVMLALFTFYTAHWQTYVTGSLKFGKIDVTEAQVVVYLIYVLTGLFGDAIWAIKIPFIEISFRYVSVIIAIVGAVISIGRNIATISRGGTGKNGSSVANTSIVFPVCPILLFLFFAFSIANKSHFSLFESNKCLYSVTFGLVWVKITIKLIIAHMTKGEIFLLDSCLIGPTVLLLNQYFNYFIPEIYVLYFSLIIVTYDLLKYCSKVCYQICTHMNIFLFKISAVEVASDAKNQIKKH